jgi:hypothetical protein
MLMTAVFVEGFKLFKGLCMFIETISAGDDLIENGERIPGTEDGIEII